MKRGTYLGVVGRRRAKNPSELNGAKMIGSARRWASHETVGGRLVDGSFVAKKGDAVVWECMYENRYTYGSMCYVRIYISLKTGNGPLERGKRTSIRLRTLLPMSYDAIHDPASSPQTPHIHTSHIHFSCTFPPHVRILPP